MQSTRSRLRSITIAVALSLLSGFAPAFGQDIVTVGTAVATGTTVDVPVFIRDSAATPLGMDQPAGSRIQSFSIKVSYAPATSVQSIAFTRSGVTASLSPTSQFSPATPGSVSLLATFQEASNPIPFTLNAAAPGDEVAHLTITLAAGAPTGTITLALDPALTQLTDDGGTAATKETVANNRLQLVDGSVTIPNATLSLSPTNRTIAVNQTTVLTVTTSRAAATATAVALVSSNPAVASVDSSVTIPANANSASFVVAAHSEGSATITATLPADSGGSNATADIDVTPVIVPPECTLPDAPVIVAEPNATPGMTYTVSWAAIGGASEYDIEEATSSTFTGATSTRVTVATASYAHTQAARFYYRVRARNRSGGCDVASPYSNVVSVNVAAVAAPVTRYIPVVGSANGAAGSLFRTSLQLHNRRDTAATGRIVFHPEGRSATSEDPTTTYLVRPGQMLGVGDLGSAMGVSGKGSADLIADAGSPLPVVLVRVFADGGASGTSGLTEEPMRAEDALAAGMSGVLIAPLDASRHRLNVGVRTLDHGAVLNIVARDRDGLSIKSVSRTYSANYFEQVSATTMLDGFVLTGGETLTVAVESGAAFVYGATTDNVTNDPSLQFARATE
jgi:hypothetical protein